MYKFIFGLVIFFSIGSYLYFSDSKTNSDTQDYQDESNEFTDADTSKNILKEKSLHQAFEKILEKKANEGREIASDESLGAVKTSDGESSSVESVEVIDSFSSEQSHQNFEQDFAEMSDKEKESMYQNLQFEINQDEMLLNQMETDQRNGLNITEADIAAITQRTEIKKAKLETLKSMMNSDME